MRCRRHWLRGVECCVTKPIRQSELFRTIATVVGRPEPVVQRDSAAVADDVRLEARLLLAEDNLINQELALAMLRKLGCTVDVANNGREAVAAAASADYDAILMDCQMPEMDGYEATALIRSVGGPARRRVPIIAVTANALAGDRERCIEAGMDDYVTKPLSRQRPCGGVAATHSRQGR